MDKILAPQLSIPDIGNKLVSSSPTYQNRHVYCQVFATIQKKILELFEAHFIAWPDESEFLETLARMIEAKQILELGMHRGFSTLHLIRAVYPDGKVYTIEYRPAHDRDFFERPEIAKCFEWIDGKTPEKITERFSAGPKFDMVFIDSDHSLEHTKKELNALFPVCKSGAVFVFHDCAPIRGGGAVGDVHNWLYDLVDQKVLRGIILPTGWRLDNEQTFGSGYDKRLNPHLGVFIKR